MRKAFTFTSSKGILLAIQCLLLSITLCAQQTSLQDYILLSGNRPVSNESVQKPIMHPGVAVRLGSNSTIEGGSVGSYRFVQSTGNAFINGNIFCGGTINLADNNTITGRISAANNRNSLTVSGAAFIAGRGTTIQGNIDVNGSIVIGGGIVNGRVKRPLASTYSGPVPAGGNVTGKPELAILPEMPEVTEFPASAEIPAINSTRTINPGSYGEIKLPGNTTLTLNGPGIYIFEKIENRGFNHLILDFQNSTAGTFKMYVHKDADLGKIMVKTINGGNASRIYTEIHGDGSNYARPTWCFNVDNGPSGMLQSRWLGTVWAPFGSINIGSAHGNSTVMGALWSSIQVNIQCGVNILHRPYYDCGSVDVNAGPDGELNFLSVNKLTGSSTTPGAQFSWQAINGGVIVAGANTPSPEISSAGTYILTVSTGINCYAKDTVVITGKTDNITGSELDALYNTHDTSSELSKTIFQISNDNVLIDVIALQGKFDELRTLLLTPPYGLFDTISNGPNSLIITGRYPIKNLRKLDSLRNLINHVRPVYPPLGKSGLIQTLGDSSMRTNYVRNGFGVQGDGIRVGVISDSYNKLPNDPAAQDVTNGDLPGSGNPVNNTPVHVLKDYPYGRQSDEGRAMLQIVHDVAPKAKLSFRTGFLTVGDFAEGIKELANDSCNVIVDDITYITEPFFKQGIIEKAINEVAAKGVHYVTAAGNFGAQSYESMFVPANTPNGLAGRAHNFGGGDILQSDSVKGTPLVKGIYTIVLQWTDDFYSLGGTATGTRNDLDIYLADATGRALFGVNSNNTGKDPIEVLPFEITSDSVVNIMIVNSSAVPGSTTSTVRFKYVVFRGDLKINEYRQGASTIVGQGNANAAITVGASLYANTPAFGVNPPTIASFSSIGGTPVENIINNKPDIVAPNGVNTSVNFGSIDYDGDGLPNFFGTSAAAPHVAGAVALMLEARKKFYDQTLSPADVKELLHTTSINMNAPGFDFVSGYGFINADSALRTFANPKPFISKLQLADSSLLPGVQPMGLIVRGNNLSGNSKIILGLDTLATTFISNTEARATLPVFSEDRSITVYTSPKSPSELDGGLSNSVSIKGLAKKNITIIANNKTRKYGAQIPVFTATILIDGDSLQHTTITAAELGLENISYETTATPFSPVNLYPITPARIFNPENSNDSLLLTKYSYAFTPGVLTIQKLPVKITPRDTTLVFGQKAGNFNFDYSVDSTAVIVDPGTLLTAIEAGHKNQLDNNVIGLINGKAVTIVNGKARPIVNGDDVVIVDGKAVTIVNGKARPIVNAQSLIIVNGKARPIVNNLTDAQMANLSFLATTPSRLNARQITNRTLVNGNYVTDTTNVVDITQESVLQFNINAAQTSLLSSVSFTNARGLADEESLTSGKAVTIVNGKAVTIVNGQEVTIVNGEAVTIVNGQAVTIVNGKARPIVNSESRTAVVVDSTDIGQGLSPLKSINMITGITNGIQSIIPGSLLDDNLEVTYGTGKLTIIPVPLTIKANDTTKVYGTTLALPPTAFTVSEGVLMYTDSIQQVTLTSAGLPVNAPGGTYPIIASNAVGSEETDLSNYTISYLNGELRVLKAAVIVKANDTSKTYGDANPRFTASYSGFVNGQSLSTSGITGAPAFNTTATTYSAVGNYDISPTQGSLASANYDFSFVNGVLTINKACLTVQANDKVICKGDPLPQFTSKIINLKGGDHPDVSYTLSPACIGAAGVYTIIPKLKPFANGKNYTVKYIIGKLYINPKGHDAKQLKPYLDCIEQLSPDRYIAHFYIVNDNKTAVYVPMGSDNKLSSAGYFNNPAQPFVFMPGTTRYDVGFDGSLLKWELKTYDGHIKSIASASADSSSPKCSFYTGGRAANKKAIATQGNQPAKELANALVSGSNINVYPNPARSRATIFVPGETINEQRLTLFNNSGKSFPVKVVRRPSKNGVEIDLSGLASGIYFMQVKVKDGYKTISIVKE